MWVTFASSRVGSHLLAPYCCHIAEIVCMKLDHWLLWNALLGDKEHVFKWRCHQMKICIYRLDNTMTTYDTDGVETNCYSNENGPDSEVMLTWFSLACLVLHLVLYNISAVYPDVFNHFMVIWIRQRDSHADPLWNKAPSQPLSETLCLVVVCVFLSDDCGKWSVQIVERWRTVSAISNILISVLRVSDTWCRAVDIMVSGVSVTIVWITHLDSVLETTM